MRDPSVELITCLYQGVSFYFLINELFNLLESNVTHLELSCSQLAYR